MKYINKVASACFYHLHRPWPWQLKRHVSQGAMRQLISAFIFNQLDYCNSELSSLQTATVDYCSTPACTERHPLGLSDRHKRYIGCPFIVGSSLRRRYLCTLHSLASVLCPEYIKDVVTPVASDPGRQQLRSAARSEFIIPRSRTKFGGQDFSIAGPEVWNRLPQAVRSAASVCQFKLTLNAHYSELHFN